MANIENLRTCSSGKVEVVAGETILISPGHGLDRPNEANPGCVLTISKNGEKIILKEVNIIYDFCRLLYIELDKVGLSYINLKERIAETTMDFTIKKRNEIANQIDKKVDASIQLCVHADANTKGYSGISLFYIAGKDRSKKIAEYFQKKLNSVNLLTRIKPDTEANVGSLGELRNTTAPAILIEIGSMDTEESRRIMYNREKDLSKHLSLFLKSFNKDRPNWT